MPLPPAQSTSDPRKIQGLYPGVQSWLAGAATGCGTAVGATAVAGGTGVTVGATTVGVAGTGVAVGGSGVGVGGIGVAVGATLVAVGGTGIAVGGTGVGVAGTDATAGATSFDAGNAANGWLSPPPSDLALTTIGVPSSPATGLMSALVSPKATKQATVAQAHTGIRRTRRRMCCQEAHAAIQNSSHAPSPRLIDASSETRWSASPETKTAAMSEKAPVATMR